eukprot:NODE_596_length_6276_cov_0.384977.p4 type:complete len:125 gc:universal NODE_596_length_6276_cov_0.384977:2610-2236(-)
MFLRRILRSLDHAHKLMELSQPAKYTPYFTQQFKDCDSQFDLIRLLNNAFSHDVVPPKGVIVEALLSCRKLNQYGLALRCLEGLKDKYQFGGNLKNYKQAIEELKPTLTELGIEPVEELGKLDE